LTTQDFFLAVAHAKELILGGDEQLEYEDRYSLAVKIRSLDESSGMNRLMTLVQFH